MYLQAARHYASAAPTAAFAGQKGSNVSSSGPMSSKIIDNCLRENTQSPLYLEMVGLCLLFV
jgi:hypothetical protein